MDKTNLMEQADSTILVYENFDEGQGFFSSKSSQPANCAGEVDEGNVSVPRAILLSGSPGGEAAKIVLLNQFWNILGV